MENSQKTIEMSPSEWCQEAASWLVQARKDGCLSDWKAQVDSGAAKLFLVHADGVVSGACVLRIDQRSDGPEGVIVAAAGNVPGVDLIATLLEKIENLFIGCVSIRAHTARPGLVRKLSRYGYEPREFVLGRLCRG